MSRSIKKLPFCVFKILLKINNILKKRKRKLIKTWSRNSTIFPEFVDFTFLVHNGKKFVPVYITDNMIGYKLGEFVFTRLFKSHPSLKRDKKNEKK